MRVLHVIQELTRGGAESVVRTLVRDGAAAGVNSAVVSAGGALAAGLDAPQFPLRRIERRPQRLAGAVRDVRAAIRAFQPDLCHVHNPAVALAAAVASARGRRPPGLVTVHGLPDADYPAAARLLRVVGLPVTACGPGVEEALREQGIAPLAMIPNGVARPAAPAERSRLAAEWQIPADARWLLAVGRLERVKNQAVAIRAVAGLPADVRLVVVGDGSCRAELARLAAEAGVADRVVFAGARADGAALAAAADVVLSTSRSEGMPLAVAEGMAAGKPVVATDVRGSRDLIAHERTGLLVPPDDPDALARAVRRVLDDPALARALGAAAPQAVAGLTDQAMVARYLALYAKLAA